MGTAATQKAGEENGSAGAPPAAGGPGGFQQRVLGELGRLQGTVTESSVTGPRRMLAKVAPDKIVEVCRLLRDAGFEHLSALTCVDYDSELQVIYLLWSYKDRCLIELRAAISGAEPKIASVTSVWTGAEFHEREAYDMFGVVFEGCPNLKRVLLPDEWSVFPLRKSFKVESIHEKRKRIEAEKAKAAKAAAPAAAPASEPAQPPKQGGTPDGAPAPKGGGAP
jgi:NADH-quinone oxidoreductase subunit C